MANSYWFNKTVSRPTTDFRADAFIVNQTVSQPTLVAVMNDWSLSQTVSNVTFVAEIISGEIYSLDTVVSRPEFNAEIISGQLLILNKNVRRPTFLSEIFIDETLYLSKNIVRPIFKSFLATDGTYTFSKTIQKPYLVSSWLNDIINDTCTTFVLNTFNSAHTQYTNYNFNSYFKLNGKYYGINATGIWQLEGELDDTDYIVSEVSTPVSSFDKQGMKACTDAILLARLYGDIEVITVTDEQEQCEGFIVIADGKPGLHRIRVRIPKGLKGATWQYKIKNVDGSQFAINNLEVFLKELQRVK